MVRTARLLPFRSANTWSTAVIIPFRKRSNSGLECYYCSLPTAVAVVEEVRFRNQHGKSVMVRIEVEKCLSCGMIWIDEAAQRIIDDAYKAAARQIGPARAL